MNALIFAGYCLAMIPFTVGCVVLTENLLDRLFGKPREDAGDQSANGDWPHVPTFRDTDITKFFPLHDRINTRG